MHHLRNVCARVQASFNWYGFLSAMGSNLTFQSRNGEVGGKLWRAD
jgi:hypothetical protein